MVEKVLGWPNDTLLQPANRWKLFAAVTVRFGEQRYPRYVCPVHRPFWKHKVALGRKLQIERSIRTQSSHIFRLTEFPTAYFKFNDGNSSALENVLR